MLVSAVITLFTILALIFSSNPTMALAAMFLIGIGAANLFPLIFAVTVERYAERANEISGLMIMAVSGGAFIPPLIGQVSDMMSITAGLYVLVACALYLIGLSFYAIKK